MKFIDNVHPKDFQEGDFGLFHLPWVKIKGVHCLENLNDINTIMYFRNVLYISPLVNKEKVVDTFFLYVIDMMTRDYKFIEQITWQYVILEQKLEKSQISKIFFDSPDEEAKLRLLV